jgi:hypothetical protein
MFRKGLVLLALVASFAPAAELDILKNDSGGVDVFRAGQGMLKPLVAYVAPDNGRPYLHPLLAPDGKGILTELSPAHHPHQTGIYVGFLKVNGRDYFHNRDDKFFRFKQGGKAKAKNTASWEFSYNWLGADKKPILVETQKWVVTDNNDHYFLDLDWSAKAEVDVTFGQYDYGGLFLRMPWSQKTGGEAINAEGLRGGQADTKKSKWVAVGMPIEGRPKDDWGYIAAFDHKDNPQHPVPWRIDGQLGVGPARSKVGEWKIAKDETVKMKYRLFVFTGTYNADKIEAEWKKWAEK